MIFQEKLSGIGQESFPELHFNDNFIRKRTLRKTKSYYDNGDCKMLKALVITPNEKTVDFGSLLSIARAEACRREQVKVNPTVRALVFVAEVGVYVAVYQVMDQTESSISKTV